MMRCICYQYQKNDVATARSRYVQRYFLRYKLFILELINELYLTFMIFSPTETKTHKIGFFKIFNRVAAIGNLPICLFDFEVAAINSFSEIFSTATISACFYHLSAYMWKKIQKWYNNNPELAVHLRMIAAFTFIM